MDYCTTPPITVFNWNILIDEVLQTIRKTAEQNWKKKETAVKGL